MARRSQTQAGDPYSKDRRQKKPERGERMTKNKTREGPLPPPDKGVNDARPGLPTPTVRKPVTWVQPEPTTADVTRPQQLSPTRHGPSPASPSRSWQEGPQGSQPLGTRQKSRHQTMVRSKYVIWLSCSLIASSCSIREGLACSRSRQSLR